MTQNMFSNYLLTHHKDDLNIILQDEDDSKHFSINIKLDRLLQDDSTVANKLIKQFESLLTECNESAIIAQNIIIAESEDDCLTLKTNIHVRFYNFPPCPELVRTVLPKNQDENLFLEVSGTIVRTTAVKLLEFQRSYKCKKCKQTMITKAIFEQAYLITPPNYCLNTECNGTNFDAVDSLKRANSKDYQEVKIQEQVSYLTVGLLPTALWVILEDDLVDSCKPGDNVTICGIVKKRWRLPTQGKKIEVEIVIKANHVYVNNDITSITIITPEIKEYFLSFWQKHKNNPLEGRDIIVKSFCPQVYGLFIVKLATMITLAGGSHFQGSDDTRVKTRSEPHLLLVGDPGTGKSQLLRFASKIIPRSVFTTGIGSTSAGLTVTAINEGGEWQLEAGALVLSDGGVCCIDEFNSMKEHDRTSIHEAMEQQTISVAKASIVCKLNTRCSILAATNPKGNLDSSQLLSLNIALPSPLLSRFDLVLILKDSVGKEWDGLVADYILDGYIEEEKEDLYFDIQMLQAYMIYIKKVQPTLTDDTDRILSAYYQLQRKTITRNKARTTVRLLDSLIRLSQGHAKLMCRSEVEIVDALTAVILIEASMHVETSTLGLEFDILSSSPENPTESYVQLMRTILSKLELYDLLEKELYNIEETKNLTIESKEVGNLFQEPNDFKRIFKKKSKSSGNVVISKRAADTNVDQNSQHKKIRLNTCKTTQFNLEHNEEVDNQNLDTSSMTGEMLCVEIQENSENENVKITCIKEDVFESNLSQNTQNKEPLNQFNSTSNSSVSIFDNFHEIDENISHSDSQHLKSNLENENIITHQNNEVTRDVENLQVKKLSQKTRNANFLKQFRFKPRVDHAFLNDCHDIKSVPSPKKSKSTHDNSTLENINSEKTELNTLTDNCAFVEQDGDNKNKKITNSQEISQNTRNKMFINQFCYKSKIQITHRNNNNQIEASSSQRTYSQSIFDKEEDYDDLDLEI